MAEIFVRVKNKKQLQTVLGFSGIGNVIADFGCVSADPKELKEAAPQQRFYLQLPDILRENKADSVKKLAEKSLSFGGIILKSFDELGLAEELKDLPEAADWKVIGDSFLYAYNTQAISFYKGFFPEMKFLLPDELTDAELKELVAEAEKKGAASASDFIYKAYGYQPVMITNQCLNRNYMGCEQPLLRFADEKKNQFYITSECGQCYDIVYNGQPTVMLDKVQRSEQGFIIDGICYENILLDFTIESEEEIRKILAGFSGENEAGTYIPAKYTRGHHYKGTE